MLVAGMISARDITWVTPPVLNIQNGCAHESKLHTQALVTNIDFAILIFWNQYLWQEPVLYGYLLHWFIIYFLIIWNSWNRKKDRNAFHHFGSVRFGSEITYRFFRYTEYRYTALLMGSKITGPPGRQILKDARPGQEVSAPGTRAGAYFQHWF